MESKTFELGVGGAFINLTLDGVKADSCKLWPLKPLKAFIKPILNIINVLCQHFGSYHNYQVDPYLGAVCAEIWQIHYFQWYHT